MKIDRGGSLKPPCGPPYNGNGGGSDSEGDDYFDGLNPASTIILSLVLFFLGYLISRYGLKHLEKGLDDLQAQLNRWVQKDPRNKYKRLYAIFLKSLAILMALFASPEAFARAIAVLGNPFLQNLFWAIRLMTRLALAIGLLLGGGVYFLDFYQVLMKFLWPLLNKTINVLAGPSNIALPVLFLEKLLRVLFASFFASGSVHFFKEFLQNRRDFWNLVLFMGFSAGLYFLCTDFV